MCGFAAIYAYGSGALPVNEGELLKISERMRPRGPDAEGVWHSPDGRAALASRRLAIIDLSPDATQPMIDGDLVVAFNGEIYNYKELRQRLEARGVRFRTTSDTEVLLHLYRRHGEEMVELLRGMFAFAIWNETDRRLFVARDPYGIKPLYFADDGQTFRAASQVKALLAGGAVSRTRDNAGIAGFFLMGSVPEPFTTFEAIRSVEAGHSFHVGRTGRDLARRHYSIAEVFRRGNEQKTIASLTRPDILFGEMISESLMYHLVSDVPVGAFLSAGIDSATLVALASQRARGLSTVTVQFDVFQGQAVDETEPAERFAALIGASHTTRVVTRSEFAEDLPRIFDAMDQPTIDGVNTWFASKAASERRLKVAITGVGGDELFGSYPAFRALPKIVRASRLARRIPFGCRAVSAAARIVTKGNPKAAELPDGYSFGRAYLIQRGLFMPRELADVIGADAARDGLERLEVPDKIESVLQPDPGTAFGRTATLEASLYMRNQLLRDTDWASMAHSLEVRTPLVDASLLRQIAPVLIVHGAECKQYLAQSADPPLPSWLASRPKRGFVVPLKEWMNLPADGTSTRMRSWARIVFESA